MGSTPTQVTATRLRVPVSTADHIRGRVDAPITLVEYGDFQCPHCGAAYANVHEVLRQRADQVRVVVRHFPVSNIHPYAEFAAETAEAAAQHGRFWEMHDWLLENQDQIDPLHLPIGVEWMNLPVDGVTEEVDSHRHLDRIREDVVGGIRGGVNGTPTFFVNGLRHDGPYTLPALLDAVDNAPPAEDD